VNWLPKHIPAEYHADGCGCGRHDREDYEEATSGLSASPTSKDTDILSPLGTGNGMLSLEERSSEVALLVAEHDRHMGVARLNIRMARAMMRLAERNMTDGEL